MQANDSASRVLVGIVLISLFTIAIGLLFFALDPAMQPQVQGQQISYDF